MCLCSAHSFHPHAIHDVCLSVRCLSLRVCPSPVSLRCLPLLFHTLPALCPALSLQCRQGRGELTTAPSHNEDHCPKAIYHPPTQSADAARREAPSQEDEEIRARIEEQRKTDKRCKERLKKVSKEIKTAHQRPKKEQTCKRRYHKFWKNIKGIKSIANIKSAREKVLTPKIRHDEDDIITSRKGMCNTFAKFYSNLYAKEKRE